MNKVPLSTVAEINPSVPSELRNASDVSVSFVPMASLSTTGAIENVEEKLLLEVAKGYRYFDEGDVLLAKITPCLENGKAGLAANLPHPIAFGSTEFHVIRPRKALNAKYLHFFIRQPSFRYFAEKSMTGAGGQRRVPATFLKRYQIPLPPIDDQIRIATLLSRVEALIATRKESLRLLDEFLKSTFLEMFGPTNPDFESWLPTKIKDLAAKHKGAMRTGPFGSNLLHSEFSDSGDVTVLGIDNAVQNRFSWGEKRYITNEKYEKLKNYRIFPGDVIVTIMGTIGRSAVVPRDIPLTINTKHLAAITLDKKKANPKFLSFSIHSSPYIIQQFENKNRGAIMRGLNLGIIKETILRMPPVDLQNRFASIIEKTETLGAVYQNNLTELENLYGALSQKAFKGELDLSRIPLEKVFEPQIDEDEQESEAGTPYFPPLDREVMSDPVARKRLLRQIFEDYFTNEPKRSISFSDFWSRVEFNVLDHMDDQSPPLGVEDYKQIKAWLFDHLKRGEVEQYFNEHENQIKLRSKS